MTSFDKIAVIKTAWCPDFLGELAVGAHQFVNRDGDSHESYNFKPGPDGIYYASTPSIGEHGAAPSPKDRDGWLVFSVAKKPKRAGIYLVGWYEDAKFLGKHAPRPEYQQVPAGLELDVLGKPYSYTLTAPTAFIIPSSQRKFHFKGTRTKRAPVYYLRGNGEKGSWREELASALIEQRDAWLKRGGASGAAFDSVGGICADATKRTEVEKQAIKAVIAHFGNDYQCIDRQKDNCGFDLLFKLKKTGEEHHVEVKGTQNLIGHFFLSRNEDHRGSADPAWRLALVTDALEKPEVEIMTYAEAEEAFDWEVVCWHAQRKK